MNKTMVNKDVEAERIRSQNLNIRFELLKLAIDTAKIGSLKEATAEDITASAEKYWNWLKENKGVSKLLTPNK